MRESFTTSDGRKLAYERAGSGPILVCHPGGPGCAGRYFGDVGGLDRHLTLVRVDPRGAGGSDPPGDGSYRLEEYAADLEQLRRHLGAERINVLGHSHGGFVAMVYASQHPESVNRLVLVGTLPRFSEPQRSEAAAILTEKAALPEFADAANARRTRDGRSDLTDAELRVLFERELPLYYVRNGLLARAHIELIVRDPLDTAALRFFNSRIAPRFDLRPLLAGIAAPTLVLAGEEDYVARPLCAHEIAAGIPDARAVVVADAGHFTWVEQPDHVRQEIATFLSER